MCSLLDLGCHVQSGIWSWWSSIGLLSQSLIVLGILAVILGISWSFLQLLKGVGGLPAMYGGIAVVVGLVLAFLPRPPRAHSDAGKPTPVAPKPKTAPAPPQKHGYNPDTGKWQ